MRAALHIFGMTVGVCLAFMLLIGTVGLTGFVVYTVCNEAMGMHLNEDNLIAIMAILVVVFLLFAKAIGRSLPNIRDKVRVPVEKEENAEDSRIIQELYRGFSRMEDRVETLETILLERQSQRNLHESDRRL